MQVLKTNIVKELVISTLGKCGIKSHYRNEPVHSHAGRHRHCMFFGNTDIKEAKLHVLTEIHKSCTCHHGRTDSNHVLVLFADADYGIRKARSKCILFRRLYTLLDIKGRNAVIARRIFYSKRIALTFLGNNMDQDRAIDLLCDLQFFLKKRNIVAVKRTEITESQIFENDRSISSDQKTEPCLNGTQKPCDRLSDQRDLHKEFLHSSLRLNISGR